ncbi:hypothetical protein [Acidihalobacter prosperus]|uniref:Uncharacterized protein n=1 Tax=Acidihalobacter prosperus TaxID=160660 RepID=A0A1A6C262_9GAMM|nr:hypothetical protein [Acidihalobacter prosperus]OBS08639.1 hypothetical protein Thpro_022889 [Acidihalobacter prosperus]
MDVYKLLTLGPGLVWESMLLWGLFALVFLYLARTHAHRLLFGLSRVLARGLRSLAALFWRLRRRSQALQIEMLDAAARAEAARVLTRDFQRLADVVRKELGEYPSLHRQASEQIVRIERDYEASVEIPPAPPDWLEAVDAVAHTADGADPALARILDAMHSTLTRASHDALEEYRYASRKRHLLLRRAASQWRKTAGILDRMDRTVTELDDRVALADRHMAAFERIRREPPTAGFALQLRYLAHFVLSLLMLGGFAVLAAGELALLHLPLHHLLARQPEALGLGLPQIAGWALVAAPVLLGALLLELGRMTRLLPGLGALQVRLRAQLMAVVAALAGVQIVFVAALVAYGSPPVQAAAGAAVSVGAAPVFASAGLSILLALLLLATELPFEAALRSGRQVGMSLLVALLGLFAMLSRILAWIAHLAGQLLVRVYDLVIFLPLAVDEAWTARRLRNRAAGAAGTERLES